LTPQFNQTRCFYSQGTTPQTTRSKLLNPLISMNRCSNIYRGLDVALRRAKAGEADILGKPYVTGYEPIRDASNNVIGIYYVGYLKT
jgi:hypothetical protein